MTDQAADKALRRRRAGRDAAAVLLIVGGVSGLTAIAWAVDVLAGLAFFCALLVLAGVLLGLER